MTTERVLFMNRKEEYIIFEIIPTGEIESEIKRTIREYRQAVQYVVDEMERTGSKKLLSSEQIPGMIPSQCKVNAMFAASGFLTMRDRCLEKAQGIRNKENREDRIREIMSWSPISDFSCVWKIMGYARIQYPQIIFPIKGIDGKMRRGRARILVTQEQRDILESGEWNFFHIVRQDNKFYARVYPKNTPNIPQDKQDDPENIENDQRRIYRRYYREEIDDILYRMHHNQNIVGGAMMKRKTAIVPLIRHFTLHPIIVVRTEKEIEYKAADDDQAACIEILMHRIGVPYNKSGQLFYIPLSADHMDTLVKYYISNRDLMVRLLDPSPELPRKKVLIPYTEEEFAFIDVIVNNKQPQYMNEIPFIPIICEGSSEMSETMLETEGQADKLEEMFLDNNIDYIRDGLKIKAGIMPESMEMLSGYVNPPEKPASASHKEINDYIYQKYGKKINGLYIAEVRREHGFRTKNSRRNGKDVHLSQKYREMIEDAFRHFGMI